MHIETKYSNGDKVYYATTRDESYREICAGGCADGRLRIEGREMTVRCPDCNGRGYHLRAKAAPYAKLLTVGRVGVEITESPGCDYHMGEILSTDGNGFTNYSPVVKREERYMCIETGIGSGSVYPVEDLFPTEAEALERASVKLVEWKKQQDEYDERREKERQRRLAEHQTEDAEA